MDSLYIVMPAYNEEEIIESVVRQWYGLLGGKSEDSRLVVASSGSLDATNTILENLMNEMPQLVVLKDTDRYHG